VRQQSWNRRLGLPFQLPLQTLYQDSQHKVDYNSQDGKVVTLNSFLCVWASMDSTLNEFWPKKCSVSCRISKRFLQKNKNSILKISTTLYQTVKCFLQNLGNVSCKINNKSISEISKALSLSKFWMTSGMWLRIHSLAWYQSGWVHRCLYTQETIQSEYCAIPLIHRFIVHSEMISWILYCVRYLRNSCTGSFSAIRILYTAIKHSRFKFQRSGYFKGFGSRNR